MSVPQTVAEVLRECESIDRMYLNFMSPSCSGAGGVVGYLHAYRGQRFASIVSGVDDSGLCESH